MFIYIPELLPIRFCEINKSSVFSINENLIYTKAEIVVGTKVYKFLYHQSEAIGNTFEISSAAALGIESGMPDCELSS